MSTIVTLWSRIPRVVRQLAVGGLATVVDTVVLVATLWAWALSPGVAAVLGCLAGGVVNFGVTRAWVFAAADRAWVPQAARYAVVVVGGGALVSGAAVAALCAAGLPVLAAKAVAVVVTMLAWTYPMSARVVFAAPPPAARDPGRVAPACG
ncbi:MAG: GtrA family protein [Kofleriaceae bacterium]